jgi:flagellar motor switch protein FliN/FliY
MGDVNVWLDAWASELAQAFELVTGQKFRVVSPSPRSGPGDADLWWVQPLSFDPEASISVGAAFEVWSQLGKRALHAAGIDVVEDAEARNTWIEMLQQSISGLMRVLSAKLGRPVECGTGTEGTAAPSAADFFSATIVAPDGTGFGVEVAVSPELSRMLQPSQSARLQAAPETTPPADVSVSTISRTMDVLRDVHLPVSISFGSAQLPLRDVLKLANGSVIELNRQPEESVDVIVNDHVIARGEVVIVDGNYAVRIQEIVSRQQRLGLRDGELRRQSS